MRALPLFALALAVLMPTAALASPSLPGGASGDADVVGPCNPLGGAWPLAACAYGQAWGLAASTYHAAWCLVGQVWHGQPC